MIFFNTWTLISFFYSLFNFALVQAKDNNRHKGYTKLAYFLKFIYWICIGPVLVYSILNPRYQASLILNLIMELYFLNSLL